MRCSIHLTEFLFLDQLLQRLALPSLENCLDFKMESTKHVVHSIDERSEYDAVLDDIQSIISRENRAPGNLLCVMNTRRYPNLTGSVSVPNSAWACQKYASSRKQCSQAEWQSPTREQSTKRWSTWNALNASLRRLISLRWELILPLTASWNPLSVRYAISQPRGWMCYTTLCGLFTRRLIAPIWRWIRHTCRFTRHFTSRQSNVTSAMR